MKKLLLIVLLFNCCLIQAQTLKQIQAKWQVVKMKTGSIEIDLSKKDSLITAWTNEYKEALAEKGETFTEEDSLANVADSKSLLQAMEALVYNIKPANVVTMSGWDESDEKPFSTTGSYTYNAATKMLALKLKDKKGKWNTKSFNVAIRQGLLHLNNKKEKTVLILKRV